MNARPRRAALAATALLVPALHALADNPGTYTVGNIPVAAGIASVEFPLRQSIAAELGLAILGQGTYDDRNPFAYLSLVQPGGWLHYDGVPNLRLSLGFQEALVRAVPALGIKDTHEERGIARARWQQPRGQAALYELTQLDVRSFDDPGGTHRVVFRPRFRLGQGFNLDAARINSLVFYEELGFQFAANNYVARPFSFFRTFAGYTWTTRHGTFVTLGIIGQVSLNPPATRYDVFWGPVLAFSHRFRPAPAEAPPEPPEIDVQ